MRSIGAVKKTVCVLLAFCMAAGFSGCTALTDELPNGYYPDETDTVFTEQTFFSETASAAAIAEESTYSDTVLSESVTISETSSEASASELSESAPTSVQTTAQTAAPTEASAETTVLYTETAALTEEAFTEAAAVTVVTIPTVTETETSAAADETTASSSDASEGISFGYYPQNDYHALNFDTQRAVWISFLEYDRIMKNRTEEEFTRLLGECMDNIAALGCNTVYFQARAHGDAYYSSELYPSGDRLAGEMGGSAGYDPLKIAVKSAHDRGLSIHAWINPMRLMTDSQLDGISDKYAVKQWYCDSSKRGRYIVSSGGRWYLNPAYSDTVALICGGISEILSSYDVDGIQIDDYFYPTTDTSFDSDAYTASGTSLSLGEWRRSIITDMVRQMYNTVHSVNPTAVFGISPQGNVENNYDQLYADVKKWCSESGYCDYICPQIYFGFENGTLPFEAAAREWSGYIGSSGVKLVIGLAAYKAGAEDTYAGGGKYEWINNSDILARQRDLSLTIGAGYAFFRYDSMFCPDSSAAEAVYAEMENLKKQ